MRYATRFEIVQWMKVAYANADPSPCCRGKVGAVLINEIDSDNPTIITAYNNFPTNNKSEEGHEIYTRQMKCEGGEACTGPNLYGRVGCRRTLHAEIALIAKAGYTGTRTFGSFVFCTWKPCLECAKTLQAAGVHVCYYCGVNEEIDAKFLPIIGGIEMVQVSLDIIQELEEWQKNRE